MSDDDVEYGSGKVERRTLSVPQETPEPVLERRKFPNGGTMFAALERAAQKRGDRIPTVPTPAHVLEGRELNEEELQREFAKRQLELEGDSHLSDNDNEGTDMTSTLLDGPKAAVVNVVKEKPIVGIRRRVWEIIKAKTEGKKPGEPGYTVTGPEVKLVMVEEGYNAGSIAPEMASMALEDMLVVDKTVRPATYRIKENGKEPDKLTFAARRQTRTVVLNPTLVAKPAVNGPHEVGKDWVPESEKSKAKPQAEPKAEIKSDPAPAPKQEIQMVDTGVRTFRTIEDLLDRLSLREGMELYAKMKKSFDD